MLQKFFPSTNETFNYDEVDIKTISNLNSFDDYKDNDIIAILNNQYPSNIEEAIKNIFYSTTDEGEKSSENKNFIFIVEKYNKKRGRKSKGNKKRKEHDSSAPDNIMTKIQIHFLTFIINLINDYIKYFLKGKRIKFYQFAYSEKRKISKQYLYELKNLTIKDLLLKLKISPKFKKCNEDNNINNLKKLNKYPWFENFVEMNYLYLFYLYYNNKLPLEMFIIGDKKIILPKKTKSFYYLLQKNEQTEEDILKAVKDFYIKDIKLKV